MDLAIDLIYELVMYGKSLSAGPLGLHAWIWPSTRGFDSTVCILRPIEEAMLPTTIFIHDIYVSLLELDTIRKGRMYEVYEMYEMYKMYEIYEMYEMYKIYKNVSRLDFQWHDPQ